MIVSCTSDWHGKLPAPDEIHGEILIIAGDLCGGGDAFSQIVWYEKRFLPWLNNLPNLKHIFLTWGNHDWIGQHDLRMEDPRVTVLLDSGVHYKGYYFYGTPWQPPFMNWAFNAPEEKLAKIFAAIPDYTDVLISHGPPKGYGDRMFNGEAVGSVALRDQLWRHPVPLVLCGHIHNSYGRHKMHSPYGDVVIHNVARLQEDYATTNPIVHLELPTKEEKTPELPGLHQPVQTSLLDDGQAKAA